MNTLAEFRKVLGASLRNLGHAMIRSPEDVYGILLGGSHYFLLDGLMNRRFDSAHETGAWGLFSLNPIRKIDSPMLTPWQRRDQPRKLKGNKHSQQPQA